VTWQTLRRTLDLADPGTLEKIAQARARIRAHVRKEATPARSEPVRTRAHRASRAPLTPTETDMKIKNRHQHDQ
jgi:hypothetical protein